jgi:heparin binding hemagglutinin HbhA
MPITLPTSTDVRKVRTQARKNFETQLALVRTPVLAWVGVNDLAVQTLRELPDELSRETPRAGATKVADTARDTNDQLAERGETRVKRIRTQPHVACVLRNVEDLNTRTTQQVDQVVDELHDTSQELLDSVSFHTCSAGEKTARRTHHVAHDVAANVEDASTELASEIMQAGDKAAYDTRGATRKAANKTAPADRRRVSIVRYDPLPRKSSAHGQPGSRGLRG